MEIVKLGKRGREKEKNANRRKRKAFEEEDSAIEMGLGEKGFLGGENERENREKERKREKERFFTSAGGHTGSLPVTVRGTVCHLHPSSHRPFSSLSYTWCVLFLKSLRGTNHFHPR